MKGGESLENLEQEKIPTPWGDIILRIALIALTGSAIYFLVEWTLGGIAVGTNI